MFNQKNHSKNAIDIVKKIRGLDKNEMAKPNKKIKNLDTLVDEIKRIEIDKYPASAYDVSTGTVNHDGVDMEALYVKFKKEDGVLTNEELKHMNREAMRLRELSLIAGIWKMYLNDGSHTFMDHSGKIEEILKKYIGKATEDQHRTGLKARLFEKLKSRKPRDEVDDFVKALASELAKAIGCSKNDVIRQIRNAEQYYVAEYHQQQALVFESNINGKTICQVDIPAANQLSEEQKKEYIKIYEADKPEWFIHLAVWEQDWLLRHVPKSLNDDWGNFAAIFQSSAMQHLPGIKNARTNYLIEVKPDTNEYAVLSSSKKTATLIPYEMPAAGQGNHVDGNAAQLITLLKADALSNFENAWGNVIDKQKIKPLIFIGSLLSNTMGASDDTALTEQQIDAINRYAANHQDIQLIAGNEPINFFRAFFIQDEKRWRYINDVMMYAGQFYQEISKKDVIVKLNPQQIRQRQLIGSAIRQLDVLKSMGTSERLKFNVVERRNYEAFKTAYACILVETMGGAVSTNCKSGKDRTGLDEIYRAAMLLYFYRYKKLPGFDDAGQDRQNFIKIFAQIFNTMKTQEAAAMNTPGSFGLKDSALVLCDDISQYLGKSYQYSNQRADMNKSQLLEKDEMAQKSETRKLNKRAQDADDDDVESLLSYVRTTGENIVTKADNFAATTPDKINKKVRELHEVVEGMTDDIETILRRQESWTNNDVVRLSGSAIEAMMKTRDEVTVDGMLAKLRAIAGSVAECAQKYGNKIRMKTRQKGKQAKDATEGVVKKFIVKPIMRFVFSQQANQNSNANTEKNLIPKRPSKAAPELPDKHSLTGGSAQEKQSMFHHLQGGSVAGDKRDGALNVKDEHKK